MPEDGNNLLPGAAIKLSQLFIGKTVVWDDKTYTCEDVQFDRTKYCIIIRCSNQNGEKILYSKKVWRTSNPNDMVTDYLEFNYPEELSTTFYYCDAHPANESYPTHRLWLAADKEIAYRNAKNYYTNKYGKYGIAVHKSENRIGHDRRNGAGDKRKRQHQSIWFPKVGKSPYCHMEVFGMP